MKAKIKTQVRVSLLGSTGLVGGHVLRLLLKQSQFSGVVTWSRREPKPESSHAKLTVLTNAEMNPQLTDASFFTTDVLISCLGTTLKTAGSKAAFRKIDFDLVYETAKRFREAGGTRMVVVSAIGADASSSVFYNQIKGELEDALTALQFSELWIVRPGLLLGERTESRVGESIAQTLLPVFNPLLMGSFAKYRSVSAEDVAEVVVNCALSERPSTQIEVSRVLPSG